MRQQPMPQSLFTHPIPGQHSVVQVPVKQPAVRRTYAGAALSGAIGTAILGALVGLVIPGVTAAKGAKYGAVIGAASGAFNTWYDRQKHGTDPRIFKQPPLAD